MNSVVAVDIGGTHIRFSIAALADGRVHSLGETVTLRTREYASFQTAWAGFAASLSSPLPRAAAIAVACPVTSGVLQLTNNPWVINAASINEKLGIDCHILINDFEAVGHAVTQIDGSQLRDICGPAGRLPDDGIVTVVGPGTGLGVALVERRRGQHRVFATEGGHIDFAPLDSIDDAILSDLRSQFRRVSVERIVSGPGLSAIHRALAKIEGRAIQQRDAEDLWTAALNGQDSLAAASLDRFCLCLGAVAGDLALAHGPGSVVIAGGIGLRLADRLAQSGFAERFVAKGRFQTLMSKVPVKLITHPQPGLFGAAVAFAQDHCA